MILQLVRSGNTRAISALRSENRKLEGLLAAQVERAQQAAQQHIKFVSACTPRHQRAAGTLSHTRGAAGDPRTSAQAVRDGPKFVTISSRGAHELARLHASAPSPLSAPSAPLIANADERGPVTTDRPARGSAQVATASGSREGEARERPPGKGETREGAHQARLRERTEQAHSIREELCSLTELADDSVTGAGATAAGPVAFGGMSGRQMNWSSREHAAYTADFKVVRPKPVRAQSSCAAQQPTQSPVPIGAGAAPSAPTIGLQAAAAAGTAPWQSSPPDLLSTRTRPACAPTLPAAPQGIALAMPSETCLQQSLQRASGPPSLSRPMEVSSLPSLIGPRGFRLPQAHQDALELCSEATERSAREAQRL